MQHAVAPATGRQRDRQLGPRLQQRQCLRLAQRKAAGLLAGRQRHHLERHFQDNAQRAHAAGHDPRHVVAGHVLHHAPAKVEHAAGAVEHAHAQQGVAHGAAAGARAERGRLAREHLAARGQRGAQFVQAGAAARRDHQFAGLVVDDAGMAGQLQRSAVDCPAVPGLGGAAAQRQRLAAGLRGENQRAEMVDHRLQAG